jgi:hypothetical protein
MAPSNRYNGHGPYQFHPSYFFHSIVNPMDMMYKYPFSISKKITGIKSKNKNRARDCI